MCYCGTDNQLEINMRIVLYIYFSLCFLVVQGQTPIPVYNLQVTMNKTTNLIFPAPITSVDRGSDRIVVQKSTGNILRVKADTVFSDTTNLTVVTTNGKLYSFLVTYASSPSFLNFDLGASASAYTDTALLALTGKVLAFKNYLHGIRYSAGKVRISLLGLYTNGEQIVCKVKIENSSSLTFETGRLRSYVSAAQQGKRRAKQQIEIEALLVHPTVMVIKARQSVVLSLVLPKAALGDGQELQIVLQEKDGERQLWLRIPNKFLLNAVHIH